MAVCLVWRVLLDRVPSKHNLRRRNIILTNQDMLCPFCVLQEETFFTCPKIMDI